MSFYLLAFLILPVAAIAARLFGKLKLPLWLIFLIYLPVGWLLLVLDVERYFDSLDVLVRSTPNPPAELLDKLQNDGAARVFAFYLGWAQAAIYFLLCLWIIKIIHFYIDKRRTTN